MLPDPERGERREHLQVCQGEGPRCRPAPIKATLLCPGSFDDSITSLWPEVMATSKVAQQLELSSEPGGPQVLYQLCCTGQ